MVRFLSHTTDLEISECNHVSSKYGHKPNNICMLHYLFNGQYLVLKKNHLSIEKTPKQAIYFDIFGSFIFLCKV